MNPADAPVEAAQADADAPRLMADGVRRADRLIVKLRDGLHVRSRLGTLTDFGSGGLRSAQARLDALAASGLSWRAAYEWVGEAKLEQMRRNAEHTLGRPMPDQNLTFLVDVPANLDAHITAAKLRALPQVEWVIFQTIAPPAPGSVETGVPNLVANQGYRGPAPAGIGATQVAPLPGGTGAGIVVADIEYSWNLAHQDLPASVTIVGSSGIDPFNDTNHGTAVLGQLASRDNALGTTGLSPDVGLVVSPANLACCGYSPAAAINSAAAVLSPGDVILIEQQTFGPNWPGGGSSFGLVPSEWNIAVYNAVVTAVGNHISVVAAAGNGSQNLDDPIYSTGNGGHWPFLPQNDSGAIIVGAGAWAGASSPRLRLFFSNFGATVDLQGWGERVTTTGYGDAYSAQGANLFFTNTFGGTSSASPIVASSVALLQSIVQANTGSVLTPAQVRQFLRTTGTPQAGTQQIGPLPNVFAAAQAVLGSQFPDPGAFSLVSPASGATAVPRPVSLSWSPSTLVSTYRLVVDNDANFSSPIVNDPTLISTSYVIPDALTAPFTTYYWKVEATNVSGTTPATPASASFTTVNAPPGLFELTAPPNNSITTTSTPTLSWQAAAGVLTYTLVLSESFDLSSPIINTSGLTQTQLLVGPGLLRDQTQYYWAVTAVNGAGTRPSTPVSASFLVSLPPCLGDANGDRAVNFTDISSVLANWGGTGPAGDASRDGAVNFLDISTVLSNWGTVCP